MGSAQVTSPRENNADGADEPVVERVRATQIDRPWQRSSAVSEVDAYLTQRRATDEALAAGRLRVGYKIGLTSEISQRKFDTDHPTFGVIFDDTVVRTTALSRHEYVVPKLEPEIAFRFDKGLAGIGLTVEDVLQAASAIVPAIEIADSRYGTWDINYVDSICDNASAAGALFCEQGQSLSVDFVRRPSCRILRNGEAIASEDATDPKLQVAQAACSVVWLVESLALFHECIEPGMFVLSGALTNAVDIRIGDHFEVEFNASTVFDLTVAP